MCAVEGFLPQFLFLISSASLTIRSVTKSRSSWASVQFVPPVARNLHHSHITPHPVPSRHQTETRGRGTHYGHVRELRSAHTTETAAPVMKPRHVSAGALGRNRQNGRTLGLSRLRTQPHTHTHTHTLGSALWRAWTCLCWSECVCLEFVPAGVSCCCPYDNMLPIGPVNLTHVHIHLSRPGHPRRGGPLDRRTQGRGVGEGQFKVGNNSETARRGRREGCGAGRWRR